MGRPRRAGGAPAVPDFGALPDLAGALCADPDFDPDSWYTEDPVLRQVVVQICWACPVIQECLETGLEQEAQCGYEAFGVRGGLTARERQAMLNQRRATQAPNPEEAA